MTTGTRNIKLTIAYQGTRYHGWQRQKDVVTVQEVIEETLGKIVGQPVRVHGASRTDAGVHAEGQAANFLLQGSPIPTEAFAWILNGQLPADIAVRESTEVPLNFHASGDAVWKTYRYHIYNCPIKDVHRYHLRWQVGYRLDLEAINAGARWLIGTHDFLGFASAKDEREETVRTVAEAEAEWSMEGELIFQVRANRFLYLMVRNIVGTLVEIGRGRWSPDRVAEVIARRDRTLAGPTAPPQGLYLNAIEYLKNSSPPLDRKESIDNT